MSDSLIVHVIVDKDTNAMLGAGGDELTVFSSRRAARHEIAMQGDDRLRVRRAKLTIFGA